MESQSFERQAQLAQWLHPLVEILRTTGGATWEALLETLDEKTAIIDLDGVVLRVRAFGGEQLQVESAYPLAQTGIYFPSNGETLRHAIAGKLTFKLTHHPKISLVCSRDASNKFLFLPKDFTLPCPYCLRYEISILSWSKYGNQKKRQIQRRF